MSIIRYIFLILFCFYSSAYAKTFKEQIYLCSDNEKYKYKFIDKFFKNQKEFLYNYSINRHIIISISSSPISNKQINCLKRNKYIKKEQINIIIKQGKDTNLIYKSNPLGNIMGVFSLKKNFKNGIILISIFYNKESNYSLCMALKNNIHYFKNKNNICKQYK